MRLNSCSSLPPTTCVSPLTSPPGTKESACSRVSTLAPPTPMLLNSFLNTGPPPDRKNLSPYSHDGTPASTARTGPDSRGLRPTDAQLRRGLFALEDAEHLGGRVLVRDQDVQQPGPHGPDVRHRLAGPAADADAVRDGPHLLEPYGYGPLVHLERHVGAVAREVRAADVPDRPASPDALEVPVVEVAGPVLPGAAVYGAHRDHHGVRYLSHLERRPDVRVAQQAVPHEGARDEHGGMQVVRPRAQSVGQAGGDGDAVELCYGPSDAPHQLDSARVRLLLEVPAAHDVVHRAAPAHAHDAAGRDVLLQVTRSQGAHPAHPVGRRRDAGLWPRVREHEALPQAETPPDLTLEVARGRQGRVDPDLDQPPGPRLLQHPRYVRPRHPDALGDVLLGQVLDVVEARHLGELQQPFLRQIHPATPFQSVSSPRPAAAIVPLHEIPKLPQCTPPNSTTQAFLAQMTRNFTLDRRYGWVYGAS